MVLVSFARPDLRFAAWFLCRTPLLAALSSLREAAERAAAASSLLPALTASRTLRISVRSSALTSRLRRRAFSFVLIRLILDLMFATEKLSCMVGTTSHLRPIRQSSILLRLMRDAPPGAVNTTRRCATTFTAPRARSLTHSCTRRIIVAPRSRHHQTPESASCHQPLTRRTWRSTSLNVDSLSAVPSRRTSSSSICNTRSKRTSLGRRFRSHAPLPMSIQ